MEAEMSKASPKVSKRAIDAVRREAARLRAAGDNDSAYSLELAAEDAEMQAMLAAATQNGGEP
jgi:hypothetical protein